MRCQLDEVAYQGVCSRVRSSYDLTVGDDQELTKMITELAVPFDELTLERVGAYVADPINKAVTEAIVRDEVSYAAFLRRFPLSSLESLTLEQYCLGDAQQPESFCRWIERGLEAAFGRYSPGTSKGHLIYRKSDGSYFFDHRLSGLSPEAAMKYVAAIIKAITSVTNIQGAIKYDSAEAVYEAAGVEARVVGGEARRLRLHTVYHPETFIPINSKTHLDHFLRVFGVIAAEIPEGAAAKMAKLWEVLEILRARYNPRLTANGFASSIYVPEMGIRPPPRSAREVLDEAGPVEVEAMGAQTLNRILYGPPGTGKTYRAIDIAVDIIDSAEGKGPHPDRTSVRRRFDELSATGRIGVVTFHQSFSYEDFIEGIRATVDANQNLRYEVEDGLFKRMCVDAASVQQATGSGVDDIAGRGIWKMSLGTAGTEDEIYDECIEQKYMLLGWGGDIDVTGCRDKNQLTERLSRDGVGEETFAAEALHRFMHLMKDGDIVVVSEGNHRFRAIGEIVGPYKYLSTEVDRKTYRQSRAVRWLRVYDPPRARDTLMERAFSQQTIYRLTLDAIEQQRLGSLIMAGGSASAKPYVLIIDEINRGNIARIFGELISLLEADKRWTGAEQLAVRLPYSKKLFSVPANLYVVGTMNTADKSLASIDHALRRRFEFVEIAPNPAVLAGVLVEGIDVNLLLEAMNERIALLFDKDHTIGHAYFLKLKQEPNLETLAGIFERQILPLLEEYFFEDLDRVRRVLADDSKDPDDQFYLPCFSDSMAERMVGDAEDGTPIRRSFAINHTALRSIASYVGIYSGRAI